MLRTQAKKKKKVEYTQEQTGNVNKEIEIPSKNSEGSEKQQKYTLTEMKNALDVAYQ